MHGERDRWHSASRRARAVSPDPRVASPNRIAEGAPVKTNSRHSILARDPRAEARPVTHLVAVLAQGDPWVNWSWSEMPRRPDPLVAARHIALTVQAVLLGLVVAIPLSLSRCAVAMVAGPRLLARRNPLHDPSLALSSRSGAVDGLSHTTALSARVVHPVPSSPVRKSSPASKACPLGQDAADGMG